MVLSNLTRLYIFKIYIIFYNGMFLNQRDHAWETQWDKKQHDPTQNRKNQHKNEGRDTQVLDAF